LPAELCRVCRRAAMSSKYGKDFMVPKDFPSVLKAFTREVLREQPANIYAYGAAYFTELLDQLASAEASQNEGAQPMGSIELEQLLKDLFQQADKDGSGALSIAEFKEVIEMANINLSQADMKNLLAEADVNNDGEIDYAEFVPIAVELVQGCYQREQQHAVEMKREMDAAEDAKDFILHGMTADELQELMLQTFRRADADNSGSLSVAEFHECIKEQDLGLTRKEINALLFNADTSFDGTISYEEFAPLCFEMLYEVVRRDTLAKLQEAPNQIQELLYSLCSGQDPDNSGKIPLASLRDILRSANLGLTRVQIHLVCSEVEPDEEGDVAFEAFIPNMAELAGRLIDVDLQKERKEALMMLQQRQLVHDMTPEQLQAALSEACSLQDASGSGLLSRADLRDALMGTAIGLSDKEVSALLNSTCISADTSGMYEYSTLVDLSFKLLLTFAGQQ